MRWLARMLAGLVIAAWSLLLIAWLTLHWGILPYIEHWRPEIEERASATLGVPVEIGNIHVRSGGWMPALELKNVALRDHQGNPALELPRVVAALSPRSLFALDLRFEQLLIDGAHLEVRRDAQGRLFVAGLAFSGPGGDDRSAADWFFRQPEFVIRGGSLRWRDEQRAAPPLSLTDVQLVVRNGLRRHEIRLDATPPPEWGDRFSLNARFTQPLLTDSGDWRRWSGVMHADLPRADVRELRRHVALPFDLSEGDGALRAWLDVRNGQPQGATVDLALREVTLRLSPQVEPLALEQIEGRLSGQRGADGWTLSARQFGFLTGDGIRWPRSDLAMAWHQADGQAATGGEFSAQRLDLALIAQIASRVPLGDAMRTLLAELNPRGIVNDLSARWSGPLDAPRTYQVKGQLNGLALAAKPAQATDAVGRPGLSQATIALNATEKGGDARLAIVDGTLEFPGVFDDPAIPLDRLAALLQWRVDPAPRTGAPVRVTVQLKEARFANADLEGELAGTWSTGDGEGFARGGRYPGRLALDGKISRGVATRVVRYLPLGIPEGTRAYVARAVQSGTVSRLTLHAKGDIWDFPFHRLRDPKDGEFRIAAQVDDVDFAYVPSVPAIGAEPAYTSPWPAFTKVSGELVFDRATMEVRNARARVFGVELSRVHGGVANLFERSVLAIDGQGRGPLADMLRFVNASPVGEWTGQALRGASGSGAADLKLALTIPLFDADASTVKGSVALAGNDVRITPDTPLLATAKARVDFTHRGFNLAGASARVLGGDVHIEGGTQPNGSVRFTAGGVATADGLRRAPEIGALSRLSASLGGQAAYRLNLGFAQGHAELDISSNLVGLSSELPPPLRKAAEQPLELRFGNTLAAESLGDGQRARDTLRFDLGDVVQARFVRDVAGVAPRVLRGGIGVLQPAPTPPSGVTANIHVPSIDADAWEAVGDRVFGGAALTPAAAPSPAGSLGGYAPTTFALRAQELRTGSRRLTKVVAGVSEHDGLWRGNVDADQLNGYVEYRPAQRSPGGAAAGRLYARLSRLSLPKSDVEGVEHLLEQQASTVPALDVVVEDLELHGKRLGRVEVEAVNLSGDGPGAAREWRLTRLAMTTPEAKLTASGRWLPSSPGSTERARSVLDFKLDLTDSGAFLERLGTAQAVRGGEGHLEGQIGWLGSPLSLDYPSLSGQVNVAIESGQFLKVQPGATRLLSVLSLQSLPRRLALDFRDVFQEGFAFDNFTGDVSIHDGVAQTNNLRMRGAQAVVLMEGRADIERETQDLRVIVVPEINAGTASLAYAAINPAIGLGTFLAQVFLRKPLTQAGTREFHVTGPWSDPKVEKVERKFNDPVPDIDAAASAVPAVPAKK
ncbi:MAG TPA: YhdP family protein [Albitalea sp.]|nr:YhdP family protein [Albitalea sp.]HUG21587.1 YhdP family protein [Albitalea sp.]